MDAPAHPSDPPADLLAVATEVSGGWLRRVCAAAAARSGVTLDALDPEIAAAVDEILSTAEVDLIARLGAFLETDVDVQRTTPLSIFRSAVAGPTAALEFIGVAHPGDPNATPGDPYGLSPATWSDIDERLHEPGIVWGAWKAMTVLRRRREERSGPTS